jgi:CubicO group peptidase (beta-lactamase class C family)
VLTQTRIEADPGSFHYNDYNPNLLALALERAAGRDRVAEMRAQLWNNLGAENAAQWSVDDHDFPYWESGFVATARDLAKVGMLMLDEDGSPLLPASWRERILMYAPSQPAASFDGSQWSYRGGWWLILRPDNRHDVAAIGRFGQLIYVSPRNNVVIVRTGGDAHPPSDGSLTRLFFAVSDRLGAASAVGAAAP